MSRFFAVLPLLAAATARAELNQCHVVEVKMKPGMVASSLTSRHEPSQIVAWVETVGGSYVDTIFITQQTGRYGLGNRPGRYDFNSGPMWPYGRRTPTFPVWAHRKTPLTFPEVIFQNVEGADQSCMTNCLNQGKTQSQCQSECANPPECESLINDPMSPQPMAYADCGDNNLSHPFDHSSRESHFCQPYQVSDPKWLQADAMTCATVAFTDKGKFSQAKLSVYPPRADLIRGAPDAPSVEMFKALNQFDAISQATPVPNAAAKIVWSIPKELPTGDYVMWLEVAQAFDHNATYNTAAYPPPPSTGPKGIFWGSYGLPYRGQPSIVYKVPFTIGDVMTTSTTAAYAGYGDPVGVDGMLRAPDMTITTDVAGSGADRLMLVTEGGTQYRVLVNARPEYDYALPGAPTRVQPLTIGATDLKLRFIAPGDDGELGKVLGYQVRYMANREMTAENFLDGSLAATTIDPVTSGQLQIVELTGLLPETDYWIGIRAFDDCQNTSDVTIVKVTTADRVVGEVDWCFVATAAYGSVMANDVELLRHFRDSFMKRTIFGELAIESYYTFGPALAGMVGESDLLRASARDALAPIIERVRRLSY